MNFERGNGMIQAELASVSSSVTFCMACSYLFIFYFFLGMAESFMG